MAIDLFSEQAAPTFDDPLGMLVACHRRIERVLGTLSRLQRHLPEFGCDNDARAAGRKIVNYFDNAAPNHHADEEQSLFPRLLRAIPRDTELLIADLEREHVALTEDWMRLRPFISAISSGSRANLSAKQVSDITARYRQHIVHEENDLIPLAAEVCDAATIAEIGREMAQRRGIDPSKMPIKR